MTDDERSMVFDVHEGLRRAFTRWEREPSADATRDLRDAMEAVQKVDAQLLANMARALKPGSDEQQQPERFWWQRD